jgi:MoaA/NifB/PqqE/SkfB family radical SAM enzyme
MNKALEFLNEKEKIDNVIKANYIIDVLKNKDKKGLVEYIEDCLKLWSEKKFKNFKEELAKECGGKEEEIIDKFKSKSLLLTILLVGGKCDAKCNACYTDSKTYDEEDELKEDQLATIIEEVCELGNKVIYIPGRGEPFLHFDIINRIIEEAEKKQNKVIVFSNGIELSKICAEKNKNNENILKKIEEWMQKGVLFIYFKLWHTSKEKIFEYLNLQENSFYLVEYSIEENKKIFIPRILNYFLEKKISQQIGIQTAVFDENYNILEDLEKFVNSTQIDWYLEPILHSGRNFQGKYNLEKENIWKIREKSKYISFQCHRGLYTISIDSKGYVGYCPSYFYLPINKRIKIEGEKKLFDVIHSDELLIKQRYATLIYPCLCEYYSECYTKNLLIPYPPIPFSVSIEEIFSHLLIGENFEKFIEDQIRKSECYTKNLLIPYPPIPFSVSIEEIFSHLLIGENFEKFIEDQIRKMEEKHRNENR